VLRLRLMLGEPGRLDSPLRHITVTATVTRLMAMGMGPATATGGTGVDIAGHALRRRYGNSAPSVGEISKTLLYNSCVSFLSES
jgi:hypothetical protein